MTALVAVQFASLLGCGGSSTVSGRGKGPTKDPTSRADLLVGTMDTLFKLEAYELGQAEQLVMSRLNQWLHGQELKVPWEREPRLDQLPPQLTASRSVRSMADDSFLYEQDFAFLREAVWMHRIAEHVRQAGTHKSAAQKTANEASEAIDPSALRFVSPDDPEALRLATALFDWTIQHIQLEDETWPQRSTYKLPQNWHTPYETVLLGRGTASDRAWTFVLLARQEGLDVVMLGLGDPGKPAEIKPWIPALVLSDAANADESPKLYLFDPELGLPIPGPNGQGIATLSQVAEDEALLRQLDLDAKRPYEVKAADVQKVTALVEASAGYLSRRMSFLESRLGGNQRMVLTASPAAIEKKLEGAQHIQSRVSMWKRPYETAALRQTEDDSLLEAARAELFPLQGLVKPDTDMAADKVAGRREESPEWGDTQMQRGSRARLRVPLGVGRLLQLAGDYDYETGALRYLQQAMASEVDQGNLMQIIVDDLRSKAARPDDPAVQRQISEIAISRVREYRRADQAAKLWIGQIKMEEREFETAIAYFTKWENPLWRPSLNYSLARVYEAQGKIDEAIKVYREDESPQRHGNLLRARRLENLHSETSS